MQRVAGAVFAQLRDVKKSHDDMTKQMQLDHDKVTKQLQLDHDKVTKQLELVTYKIDKLDEQHGCMITALVMLASFNVVVYCILLYEVSNGRSKCLVPKWNVAQVIYDDYPETAQGQNIYTVPFFTGMLSSFLGWFVVGISPE